MRSIVKEDNTNTMVADESEEGGRIGRRVCTRAEGWEIEGRGQHAKSIFSRARKRRRMDNDTKSSMTQNANRDIISGQPEAASGLNSSAL